MKTNSKHVRALVRSHILECVTDNHGDTLPSFPEAAQRLAAEFDRVANHHYNLRRIPNHQDRFQDYLMGLPFSFEYTHAGIEAFLNSLGINPSGRKYSDDKMAALYSYLIFSEMVKATQTASA
jgi:hypothetical protein